MDLVQNIANSIWGKRKVYAFPLTVVLVLRIGLSIWMAIVWMMLDQYFPITDLTLWESYYLLDRQASLVGRMFIDVWLRWDAVHLMNIAKFGYSFGGPGELNYFPLYSLLTRWISILAGGNVIVAGLIISTVSTGIAFIILYELCLDAWESMTMARWAVIVFAIYPTSFFLFAPFSDALFICLTIGCLLAVRRKLWLASGILAGLAGFTRGQGILLMLPIAYGLFQEIRKVVNLRWKGPELNSPQRPIGHFKSNILVIAILTMLLAPSGWIIFMNWRGYMGVSSFVDSFSLYSNVIFENPVAALARALQQAQTTGDPLVYSEILSLVIFGAVLGWMLTKKMFRSQVYLIIYSISTLLLFLSKTSNVASVFQSANRYVLSIFPVFIGVAALVLKLPKLGRRVYISFSLSGLIILATLYALWIFVG